MPAISTEQTSPSEPSLRAHVVAALATVALLFVGFGGWAATAMLSGAVVAPGLVVVDSSVKKIQHPVGGIVDEIRVRNGQRVGAGDLLVKLDDTQTRAALAIIVSQLVELTGRQARLAAERDGLAAIEFPSDFESNSADALRVAQGERRLFEARHRLSQDQKAQLRERIGQLQKEIDGLTSQRGAKVRELALVREELARVSDLKRRQLMPVTRVLAMQRDEARIDGEYGTLVAQIARAGGQINEIELQILSIDETIRTDAQKDSREIEARIAELAERRIAAEDQLKRIVLRAPISGIVHELAVHTVGGVISAGEAVMLIVPDSDALSVEIQVRPGDIDQVSLGQKTNLRLTAFSQRATPEIAGTVTRIGADLTRQPQTGQAFFVARVRIDADELKKLNGMKLVPGMPVEAFIETGQRTALSLLVKPFADQLARAFREE